MQQLYITEKRSPALGHMGEVVELVVVGADVPGRWVSCSPGARFVPDATAKSVLTVFCWRIPPLEINGRRASAGTS